MSSTTAALFPNATIPLRNTLCVHRFRIEADQLSPSGLQDYHCSLPAINDIANLMDILKHRTASLSARNNMNTFLDCAHYETTLRQHIATFAMGSAMTLNQSKTLAKDAFYIICGLYFACDIALQCQETNRDMILWKVAEKLERQLTGIDPSLQLLQSYRMLSMAHLWRNKTKEARRSILCGSRAATSMGIHQVATMSTHPKEDRSYLTDALLNLTCDSCMMQAVFGTRTSIDPGSIEASLFDLGESILEETEGGCPNGSVNHSSVNRNLPVRLRMHASLWIFLERHYGSGCELQVPTEESLIPNRPLCYADPYEVGQSISLNNILTRSSQELEKPLLPWFSTSSQEKASLSESEEIGLHKAIQMLFLVRYYRCLVVYPFLHLNPEARLSLEETVRSIINSTWRIAKRSTGIQMSNLDFCRRICLRGLALLAASKCDNSHKEGLVSHAERQEQIIAEFELGTDAIEKIDNLLKHTKPLAGLVATLQ